MDMVYFVGLVDLVGFFRPQVFFADVEIVFHPGARRAVLKLFRKLVRTVKTKLPNQLDSCTYI